MTKSNRYCHFLTIFYQFYSSLLFFLLIKLVYFFNKKQIFSAIDEKFKGNKNQGGFKKEKNNDQAVVLNRSNVARKTICKIVAGKKL